MVNLKNLKNCFKDFHGADPFDYCVVDNFLLEDVIYKISGEFLYYEDERWHEYNNALELKKTLNDWNIFPAATYSLFNYLNSNEFVAILSQLVGEKLFSDPGLHGGGWHIHGEYGNLNPHLDYSIHPKLGLQRRLNIIIYVEDGIFECDGGHLGLWGASVIDKSCGSLRKEIQPLYNRAVIFDTTQNSWHGMSRPFIGKNGKFRKSIAVYYLSVPQKDADQHSRALFAPRLEQIGNNEIKKLIEIRSSNSKAHLAYRANLISDYDGD